MKKKLIENLVLELGVEGFDIDGLIFEEGVMVGNYGLIGYDFFDDIDDSEIKNYLIDFIKEYN
jgi:hypothetical protein